MVSRKKPKVIELKDDSPKIEPDFLKKIDLNIKVGVEPEFWLWTADGRTIKDEKELARALKDMPDATYKEHVTKKKNDFAQWASEILGNDELAIALRKARSRKLAASTAARIARKSNQRNLHSLTKEAAYNTIHQLTNHIQGLKMLLEKEGYTKEHTQKLDELLNELDDVSEKIKASKTKNTLESATERLKQIANMPEVKAETYEAEYVHEPQLPKYPDEQKTEIQLPKFPEKESVILEKEKALLAIKELPAPEKKKKGFFSFFKKKKLSKIEDLPAPDESLAQIQSAIDIARKDLPDFKSPEIPEVIETKVEEKIATLPKEEQIEEIKLEPQVKVASKEAQFEAKEKELFELERELNEEEKALNEHKLALAKKRYHLIKEKGRLESEKFDYFMSQMAEKKKQPQDSIIVEEVGKEHLAQMLEQAAGKLREGNVEQAKKTLAQAKQTFERTLLSTTEKKKIYYNLSALETDIKIASLHA